MVEIYFSNITLNG